MVTARQLATKCKGDRVIASSNTANITLVGLHLERQARPYQRSHVAVDGADWYCQNGHLFRATGTFVLRSELRFST